MPANESALEFLSRLAKQTLKSGNYTHSYKREKDFDLKGASAHLMSLNQQLGRVLNSNLSAKPCISPQAQLSLVNSSLFASLQQVQVYLHRHYAKILKVSSPAHQAPLLEHLYV